MHVHRAAALIALGRLKEASHDLLHSADLGLGPFAIWRTMEQLAPPAVSPVTGALAASYITRTMVASSAVVCVGGVLYYYLLQSDASPGGRGGVTPDTQSAQHLFDSSEWGAFGAYGGWPALLLVSAALCGFLCGMACFLRDERRARERRRLHAPETYADLG